LPRTSREQNPAHIGVKAPIPLSPSLKASENSDEKGGFYGRLC